MSRRRDTYTQEEKELLERIKGDNPPGTSWDNIAALYNNEISDPRRHRSADGLNNKYKALKKKKKRVDRRLLTGSCHGIRGSGEANDPNSVGNAEMTAMAI